jgi:hypothetical protein
MTNSAEYEARGTDFSSSAPDGEYANISTGTIVTLFILTLERLRNH